MKIEMNTDYSWNIFECAIKMHYTFLFRTTHSVLTVADEMRNLPLFGHHNGCFDWG